MFELMDADGARNANIKVIGIGGGGGNAVRNMLESGIEGVDFLCANTDAQALQGTGVERQLQLGNALTKGLGAGANPEIGRKSALEDRETIKDFLIDTDMLFITAGMGGGTGTGAAPVVAQIAKELDILTVAVVTKPFPFEGPKRMRLAEAGIVELCKSVDSLITIPNAKLLTSLDKNITLLDAFKAANDVLLSAVQGISDLITHSGLINVDFADVKTVMSGMGVSMMGTGIASGDERATEAAQAAVSSPLLDDINLKGAHGILVNITGGMDMGIHEFEEVGEIVRNLASDDAVIVVGNVIDMEMKNELRVTLVATGLDKPETKTVHKSSSAQQQTRRDHLQAIPADHTQRATNDQRHYANNNVASKTSQEKNKNGYLDIPSFLRNQSDK